jgi:hypothetical protein
MRAERLAGLYTRRMQFYIPGGRKRSERRKRNPASFCPSKAASKAAPVEAQYDFVQHLEHATPRHIAFESSWFHKPLSYLSE